MPARDEIAGNAEGGLQEIAVESENVRRHETLESRTSSLTTPALRLDPPPSRILVKEVNWLGDVVMSLPALRAIRRAWPRAHLAVLIKKELASFFDGARWLDEMIPYSVGRGLSGFFDRRFGQISDILNSIWASLITFRDRQIRR